MPRLVEVNEFSTSWIKVETDTLERIISHNRLFLDFYFFFTFLVPFKTFLVLVHVLD